MIDVTLESVSKRFARAGDTAAVDDVDISIAAGEFFTLLGPSGCGKTTTLRMIAGFEAPDRGADPVGGPRTSPTRPPNHRDIGMVFQNYALFPHMTVVDNVAYGLKIRRCGRAEVAGRVARGARPVRLAGYGDRRSTQLSGGQQQRVALARAIVIAAARCCCWTSRSSNLDAKLREETAGGDPPAPAASSASPPSTSPTTRSRRWRCPTDRGDGSRAGPPARRPARDLPAAGDRLRGRFIGRSNVLDLPVVTAAAGTVTVGLPDGSETAVTAPADHGLRAGTPPWSRYAPSTSGSPRPPRPARSPAG